ncbi:translation initiation factor IF-3 [candidate division TM6 bacterium RIFCSPHIGHO2_12_FULL_32_22]|nr:MAG: translation initiation factor IF-3 [candidate division TM6 bacterium RIFCSPHIGHO2_12_FULL_32_22]
MKEKEKSKLPLVNERIPGLKVQLISHEGANVGPTPKNVAIKMAEDVGLDLVLISDQGSEGLPVAKIMDLGKAIYAKKKKASESKKKQKVIKVKEIKIRPKIGEHDLNTKIKQAAQFLEEGKKIKFTLIFKGREVTVRNEVGPMLFEKFENRIKNSGFNNLLSEGESRMGQFWSKIYFLK